MVRSPHADPIRSVTAASMSDRAQAIAILEQARDILTRRLIERIVDHGDEILDDARGECYSGEIDSLQEQLGMRISHVNLLLNCLPPDLAAAVPSFGPIAEPAGDQLAPSTASNPDAWLSTTEVATSSQFVVGPEPADSDWPTFVDFVRGIQANDFESAAAALVMLLNLSEPRAQQCAETFHRRMREAPEFLTRAMELRYAISGQRHNNALALLWECFGLQGPEALLSLEALRGRFLVE